MDKCSVFSAALLLLFAVYVTGQLDERILIDDKCKCVKITSRFGPAIEAPSETVVEWDVVITLPLNSRENISDPTSPTRVNFIYDLNAMCQKCNGEPVEVAGTEIIVPQINCGRSDETCYTYDRNKCYTTDVKFKFEDQFIIKKIPITPASCL